MPTLPRHANLDHLKKQAKDLLRLYRNGDPEAIARFRQLLPLVSGWTSEAIAARALRLHDAQSYLAREYGFASWADLSAYVEAQARSQDNEATRLRRWLALVYGGDARGGYDLVRPRVAAQLLRDAPGILGADPYAACAVGDVALLRRATADDPAWVNRPGGPLAMPPLVAVTHSRLMELPEFGDPLRQSARLFLEAGADPNQSIGDRFPPASLAAPDEAARLSALYGAAGVNRDPEMTDLLLRAGADPNDGESLYHSLENMDCARLLLQHGARVTGTNALGRALDMPKPVALNLLLAHGGDANEPGSGMVSVWGGPLLRAIAVRSSTGHVRALLGAGADPLARTPEGISAYRLAAQVGLPEVVDLLKAAGAAEALADDEQFVAACANGDEAEARRIQERRPDLPASLEAQQLRLLPDAVAWGRAGAAKLMVELGWPIGARGGDWDATALNLAVFRGEAELTEFLLSHGADWRERHGYGDNVLGTLSWASVNEPTPGGDWAGCARALLAHGAPQGAPDPDDPELVRIDGQTLRFSPEVAQVLIAGDTEP